MTEPVEPVESIKPVEPVKAVEKTDSKNSGEKTNITIRVSEEDKKMIQVLRKKYFINISEYVRASIKHLYDSKTKK